MVLTMLPMAAMAASFDDVADDHWAASSIDRWAGYGVLTGHGNGTFTPDRNMTRAEFASMLVKMLGLTAKSDKVFTDVDADAWYADVISIAVAAGIINGKSPDAFAPDDPVSFEEAAVMMCRAFGLAKTTSGDDWSKESIEKLTSLGVIGEGADEHLQVGVKCDRAVVAALADAVVAEYVNEDRAEPITGEIKGVVLVVNQAKVEIKDATVAAPIVVESASVTLTNTQADNVKVSGNEAAVTADKESSVADVTVSGTAPAVAIEGQVKGDVSISGEAAKVELNGEVAGSVTVEEAATGAEIKGDGVTADKVTNNSAEDVKVNDETVDAKPDDAQKPTTPSTSGDDDNSGSTDDNTGSGSTGGNTGGNQGGNQGGTTDPTKPTEPTKPDLPEAKPSDPTKDEVPEKTTTDGNKMDEDGKPIQCETHDWGEPVVTAATCTANGTSVITCNTCGATETTYTAKAAHQTETKTTPGDCVTEGTEVVTCTECHEVQSARYTGVDSSKHKTEVDIPAVAPTCGKDGTTAGKKCTACNTVTVEPKKDPATGEHSYKNGVCETCGNKMTDDEKKNCDHSKLKGGATCPTCGQTVETTQANCPEDHSTINKNATCAKCGAQGTFDCTSEHASINKNATCPKCGEAGTYDCSSEHANILTTDKCPKCGAAGEKEPTTSGGGDTGGGTPET